jgi:hypothetical protein
MKRKLLYLSFLISTYSLNLNAQDINLHRTSTDNATVPTFTYSNGDAIDYLSTPSTSTSAPLCGLAGRRVQINEFRLTVKSTSISKIVISGGSSGASARHLKKIAIGADTLVSGTDYTTVSTITNADCATITISGLNILRDAANGKVIYISFSSDVAGTSTNQNVRVSEIILTPISTAPLDFLSFSAKPDALNKFVNLNWSTTNEVNTKNFEIQKRTDASDFKTIGVVKSKNISGVHQYAFADDNLTSGTSYYRLSQVDNDGKSSFSDVVTVNVKSAVSLSVYPNPVENFLSLSHPVTSNKAFARIVNLEGKTILQQTLNANVTTSQIDVSQLATGSYLIVLEDELEKSTLKFIKK